MQADLEKFHLARAVFCVPMFYNTVLIRISTIEHYQAIFHMELSTDVLKEIQIGSATSSSNINDEWKGPLCAVQHKSDVPISVKLSDMNVSGKNRQPTIAATYVCDVQLVKPRESQYIS